MKNDNGNIKINYVDIIQQQDFLAEVVWQNGIIKKIAPLGNEEPAFHYLFPGFIDAHVHIESSMLTPVEFSRLATRHGTVASVSDPHEIANVMGLEGIHFMFENAALTPFKIFYGAPSCVPATPFETAGARLGAVQLEALFEAREVGYLSEVMNYPDVLNQEPGTLAKLALAQAFDCPVDGHAPAIRIACEQIMLRLKQQAADILAVDVELISLREEHIFIGK